jgi:hypothetical protein
MRSSSISVSAPVWGMSAVPAWNPQHQFSPLLCRQDAASYLGVLPQTLAQWACSRRVLLPFVKIGRKKVMYRRSDLDAFIAANVHGTANGAEACHG